MNREQHAEMSTAYFTKTPLGQGIKTNKDLYVPLSEITAYINRELAKRNKTRDAILTNLQSALHSMRGI